MKGRSKNRRGEESLRKYAKAREKRNLKHRSLGIFISRFFAFFAGKILRGSLECSNMSAGLKQLAVCLVSGGMDSCVTAAIAARESRELAFLHVSYRQRTEARERCAFNEIAGHYGVAKRLDVSIEHLAKIGGSSLTDPEIAITEADLVSKDIPTSYVPFRNANMLSIAVSWAEVLKAGAIYIGAVAEDSSGYPDCRPEFYRAFQAAIDAGTKPDTHVEIRTPMINLSKAKIVKKGLVLEAPLHLTWSCYRNEELACGTCDSCALRLRGFEQAGHQDPIQYLKQ
jgi:7-cyano-7-deazaguanine synthase